MQNITKLNNEKCIYLLFKFENEKIKPLSLKEDLHMFEWKLNKTIFFCLVVHIVYNIFGFQTDIT